MKYLVLLGLLTACGSHPCTGADAVADECIAEQVKRGCDKDPERLCPELVKQCESRIDALTDEQVCP